MSDAGGITLSKGVPPAYYTDVHLKPAFSLYLRGIGSPGSWERKCRTRRVVSKTPRSTMWLLLQFVWLCFLLSLGLNSQYESEVPEYPDELRCGLRSFQFTINLLSQEMETPPALVAWGKFEG